MRHLKGYIMIMGAALFWGISATAAKSLLNRQLNTILIVQSRVTITFLLMFLYFAIFQRSVLQIMLADLWRFALLGIVGIAGSNYTYYFTIKESSVATGILIQYTAPLLVMGYAVFTREEEVTLVKLCAAVLSLVGCFLAVGAYDSGVMKITPIGLVSGAGSVLCFTFLNISSHRLLARYNMWAVTFYAIAFASLFWLVINPPWKVVAESPSFEIWYSLLFLAIVSVLIPHSLYFSGLKHIVPSRAVITSTLEPVVAIVSASFFLGEYLFLTQVIGATLVIVAIVLLQLRREPPFPDTLVKVGNADAA
jgi:DME family drug/metabolite transporter